MTLETSRFLGFFKLNFNQILRGVCRKTVTPSSHSAVLDKHVLLTHKLVDFQLESATGV